MPTRDVVNGMYTQLHTFISYVLLAKANGLSGWNTCYIHNGIFMGLHFISHDLGYAILSLVTTTLFPHANSRLLLGTLSHFAP